MKPKDVAPTSASTSASPSPPTPPPAAVEEPETEPQTPLEEADEPREGKPELETPEGGARSVPEETPRDDQDPLEIRAELVLDGRHVAREVLRAVSLATKSHQKSVPSTPVNAEVTELFRHVADNPVDSHAPAWAPRTPNTTGGYS